MKIPFLRTQFNYNMNDAGDESALACKDQSLTQQSFRDEVDINTIVERFHLTGEVPQLEKLPSYDDFTGVFDYQTAMNAIVAARHTFDSLPAKLRARFNNDPAQFVDFCDDGENIDEAIKLGLVDKKITQEEQLALELDRPVTLNDLREAFKVPENKGETPKPPKT